MNKQIYLKMNHSPIRLFCLASNTKFKLSSLVSLFLGGHGLRVTRARFYLDIDFHRLLVQQPVKDFPAYYEIFSAVPSRSFFVVSHGNGILYIKVLKVKYIKNKTYMPC